MRDLTPFADLITNQRARGSTADGAQRAAKYSVASHTAENCTGTSADLCVGWVSAAAGHGKKGSCGN